MAVTVGVKVEVGTGVRVGVNEGAVVDEASGGRLGLLVKVGARA